MLLIFLLQVFDIIDKNQKSSFETCYFLNHCGPDDNEETTQSSSAAKWNRKSNWFINHMMGKDQQPSLFKNILGSQNHRKNRRSIHKDQNLFKVAQITDIHVDERYLEVKRTIKYAIKYVTHKLQSFLRQ